MAIADQGDHQQRRRHRRQPDDRVAGQRVLHRAADQQLHVHDAVHEHRVGGGHRDRQQQRVEHQADQQPPGRDVDEAGVGPRGGLGEHLGRDGQETDRQAGDEQGVAAPLADVGAAGLPQAERQRRNGQPEQDRVEPGAALAPRERRQQAAVPGAGDEEQDAGGQRRGDHQPFDARAAIGAVQPRELPHEPPQVPRQERVGMQRQQPLAQVVDAAGERRQAGDQAVGERHRDQQEEHAEVDRAPIVAAGPRQHRRRAAEHHDVRDQDDRMDGARASAPRGG